MSLLCCYYVVTTVTMSTAVTVTGTMKQIRHD